MAPPRITTARTDATGKPKCGRDELCRGHVIRGKRFCACHQCIVSGCDEEGTYKREKARGRKGTDTFCRAHAEKEGLGPKHCMYRAPRPPCAAPRCKLKAHAKSAFCGNHRCTVSGCDGLMVAKEKSKEDGRRYGVCSAHRRVDRPLDTAERFTQLSARSSNPTFDAKGCRGCAVLGYFCTFHWCPGVGCSARATTWAVHTVGRPPKRYCEDHAEYAERCAEAKARGELPPLPIFTSYTDPRVVQREIDEDPRNLPPPPEKPELTPEENLDLVHRMLGIGKYAGGAVRVPHPCPTMPY